MSIELKRPLIFSVQILKQLDKSSHNNITVQHTQSVESDQIWKWNSIQFTPFVPSFFQWDSFIVCRWRFTIVCHYLYVRQKRSIFWHTLNHKHRTAAHDDGISGSVCVSLFWKATASIYLIERSIFWSMLCDWNHGIERKKMLFCWLYDSLSIPSLINSVLN